MGGWNFPVLFSTVDHSSILILIIFIFLPQIPSGTCHTSVDAKQQPNKRVPVITGLRLGLGLLLLRILHDHMSF